MRPSQGSDLLGLLLTTLSGSAALPELTEGDFTLEELLAIVRESPERIVGPLRGALNRAAERLQEQEQLSSPPAARIAVVVDQLEELFTDPQIGAQARDTFAEVLAALARSGLAWVISTIRSDFFHRCSEVPPLVGLKDGLGSYELLPPVGPEIAQLIRNPARASGLRFEEEPTEGRLDDVLHEAASQDPSSLPLLEFVLDTLYEASGEDRVLTFAAYRAIGQLEGAIAKRADDVVKALPADVQKALPAVIRALVTVRTDEGTATARVVSMAQISATPQQETLVKALIAARLLVTDGEGGEAVVRVAHKALLNRWPQAQAIIRESREDLLTRERVRADASLWDQEDRNSELLLPSGKRLTESADLLNRRREELDHQLIEYIEASQTADNRHRFGRIAWVAGAFIILVGLLGAALWQWQEAERQAALALSRQLSTHSEEFLSKADHQRALLLAVEAFSREKTREASSALKASLEATPLLERTLWVSASRQVSLAFSPDGEQLAVYHQEDREKSGVTTFEVSSGTARPFLPLSADFHWLAWGKQLVGIRAEADYLLLFDEAGRAKRVPVKDCRKAWALGSDVEGTITIACYAQLMRVTKKAGRWSGAFIDGAQGGAPKALSGNGHHALFGGKPSVWHDGDRQVSKLDLMTMSDKKPRPFQSAHVWAIDCTGRRVAARTARDILVWTLDGPSIPVTILPAHGRPEEMRFSSDGRRLALAYGDGRIEIFGLGTVQPLAQPLAARRPDDKVNALAMEPNRSHLAVGTQTGFVTLQRLTSDSRDAQVLSGWRGPIHTALFLSPQSGTAAADSIVIVEEGDHFIARRVHSREPVGESRQIKGQFLAAAAAEDVVSVMVMTDAHVTIANLTAEPALDLELQSSLVNQPVRVAGSAGAFSRSSRFAAFVHKKGDLTFYNRFSPFREDTRFPMTLIGFDNFGRFTLAVADIKKGTVVVGRGGQMASNPLYVWSPHDDTVTELWEGRIRYDDLLGVDVSANGDRVVAVVGAVRRGQLLMWERDNQEWRERVIEVGRDKIDTDDSGAVALHPSGASLAVGDGRGQVSLVDFSNPQVQVLEGDLGSVPRLTFSQGGKFLAAATDRDVRVWDLATGKSVGGSDNLLTSGVDILAFEDGGRRLSAAAKHGGAVVRWSLDGSTPKRIDGATSDAKPERTPCRNRGKEGEATTLELSPGVEFNRCTAMIDANGVSVQVGMLGTWSILWEVPTGDWIDRACRQAGRNLSAKEWTQSVGESVAYRKTCPGNPIWPK